jgi:hypothetical protein
MNKQHQQVSVVKSNVSDGVSARLFREAILGGIDDSHANALYWYTGMLRRMQDSRMA